MQTTPTRAEQLVSLASTLRRVRWLCVVFAAVVFTMYAGPKEITVPHPVGPWGVLVCGWLVLTNEVTRRMAGPDERRMDRLAAYEVAADSALVLFVIALLAFDQVGAEWGLLNIVVIEAALRLPRRGAITCYVVNAGAYLAIQVWAEARYGVDHRWTVALFRMGMVLVVGITVGSVARQAARHLDAMRHAQEEADERARLLRIAADAGRSMAYLGSDGALDAVTDAALELGFDAVDVCVLDEAAGKWRLERAVNLPADYVEQGQSIDVGLSAAVRRAGHTIVIDDYFGWEGGLESVRASGFTTVIGVPVRVEGDVVATLGVGTRRPRPVSEAELECLELLAAQASAALDAALRQSQARGLQDLLAHTTTHDRLTGLPNREELLAHLDRLLPGDGVAVLVCDLDGFRTLNDSLGHQAGDQLLQAVAHRLQAVGGDRLVARLAGDEFALVVDGGGLDAAGRLAQTLLTAFSTPLDVDGSSLNISMSIGAAAGEQSPLATATSLLRDAGLALERAKHAGRGRSEVFDASLRASAQQRLAIETDLRAALAEGTVNAVYQPIVSLETGSIVGVEALARWTHASLGPIAPSEFIPIAEDAGLIQELGLRVLEIACRSARAWQQLGGAPLRISVNLSAVQLTSERCAESVAEVLRRTGLAASALTLEITESAVMDDVPEVLRSIQALADLGVRLSVDDLGRGWSSLAYLTRYPLSELKIDRSFVQGVARRPADGAVVRSLVSLAHDLGLTVVAEGIEDGDQLAALARLGCDAGQGFHLHRPQSAADITELLAGGVSLRVG